MNRIFLVSRDGREYFFKDELPEWAKSDEYQSLEFIAKESLQSSGQDIQKIEFLEERYSLDEAQIANLKIQLEEAVELIEVVEEFSSRPIETLSEGLGLTKLIGDACAKFLKSRD